MDRALPGYMIDLIRDGVHPTDLRARGDKAVWAALVKTASSAQLRGWGEIEWEALILEPKSVLGRQASTRDGHKPKKPLTVSKMFSDAWDSAWEWRTSSAKAWSREEVREHANSRAAAIVDVISDPTNDLAGNERAVLNYAAEQTVGRGLLRVALPWRAVVEATGLGERSTKNALDKLQRRGLLILEVRGKSGATEGKRRANLYALPASGTLPSMCRGTRPMGPPAHTYGTPAEVVPMGPPAIPMGPPEVSQITRTRKAS